MPVDMTFTHVTAWQHFQTPLLLPYSQVVAVPSEKTISLDNGPSGFGA